MTNLLYSLMIFNERLEGFFIGLCEGSADSGTLFICRPRISGLSLYL